MAITPRFAWNNLLKAEATLITASSQQPAFQVRYLRDQLRSLVWRSKVGWTIISGWNDKIDFNNGSDLTATIATGTYSIALDLCTAIRDALDAAYAPGVWAVVYDPVTRKFEISHNATAFVLKWATGTNAPKNPALDLGWTAADTGSSASHMSPNATTHSREYVLFDLGSAQTLKAGIVINHNAGTSGTFKLQGAATAAGALTAPSTTQTLVGDADIRILYFSSQSYQHWALVIEDVANTDGFSQAGVVFGGDYLEMSAAPDHGFVKDRSEISRIEFADGGAQYQTERATRRIRRMSYSLLADSFGTTLETMLASIRAGRNFFFTLDPASNPSVTLYGYLPEGVSMQYAEAFPLLVNLSMDFHEALD